MSPTICSSTSSMVIKPDTPPYSSMTMAIWLWVERNSLSSTFSRLDSGTQVAGRSTSLILKRSVLSSSSSGSRSLASRMPSTSSMLSPITGKRECAASMTEGRNSRGVWAALMVLICDRGIMMSRTCISATCKAPSMIASASTTRTSLRWASRSSSSSSWRLRGSWTKAWVSLSSQDFCPVLDRSSFMGCYSSLFNFKVGIGDAQFGQQLAFQCFHGLGFVLFNVVMTQQMQAAMDDHMGPVCLRRLALLGGFPVDHGHADDQITQQRDLQFRGQVSGEGQHIGGVVPVPVLTVQCLAFFGIDQANGQFMVRLVAQGQGGPA